MTPCHSERSEGISPKIFPRIETSGEISIHREPGLLVRREYIVYERNPLVNKRGDTEAAKQNLQDWPGKSFKRRNEVSGGYDFPLFMRIKRKKCKKIEGL
jgi:hypothetical protein